MAEAKKADGDKELGGKTTPPPRKIPGNLPYLPASGTLKRALERLIDASRPDKFNADFLENVLKLSGGSARATIPIFKKMGLLTSDGVPTELYAKFRTEGGRGPAALQALKNAFPEIFKRSEYAHSVDENKLRDIILEITGLKANDPVAIAIKSTFNVIKSFIPNGMTSHVSDEEITTVEESVAGNGGGGRSVQGGGDGISKNTNRTCKGSKMQDLLLVLIIHSII